MPRRDLTFKPQSKPARAPGAADDAVFTWFSPPEMPKARFRYAVIKEEDGLLQILPDEGRFKAGLTAWRFPSEDAPSYSEWRVLKVRPNRVDLEPI